MGSMVMADVWDHQDVGGSELLLLIAMADSADNSRRECYLSQESMAKMSRCSVRHVRRLLDSLLERGLIEDTGHVHPQYRTKVYVVLPPDIMSAYRTHPGHSPDIQASDKQELEPSTDEEDVRARSELAKTEPELLADELYEWAEANGIFVPPLVNKQAYYTFIIDLVQEKEDSPQRRAATYVRLIKEYIAVVTQEEVSVRAHKLLARLVANHHPREVMRLVAQALDYGAGLGEEYEKDPPFFVVKYATGIMRGERSQYGR